MKEYTSWSGVLCVVRVLSCASGRLFAEPFMFMPWCSVCVRLHKLCLAQLAREHRAAHSSAHLFLCTLMCCCFAPGVCHKCAQDLPHSTRSSNASLQCFMCFQSEEQIHVHSDSPRPALLIEDHLIFKQHNGSGFSGLFVQLERKGKAL